MILYSTSIILCGALFFRIAVSWFFDVLLKAEFLKFIFLEWL